MRFLNVFFVLLIGGSLYGQTWSDDAASIVYNKCAQCHHTGGIAPFPLMSYSDALPIGSSMLNAINTDEMPPYPPDENYQQYSHSKSLTASEKATLTAWLSGGMPEGNASNTPPPPVFNPGSLLGNGDLTVQIPTYMSKAQGFDDYVCFSIPLGLTQGRTIRAMEVVPGNRQIVHHALIYIDPTGNYVSDTVGGNCSGPSNGTLIGGYTPGSTPLIFPSGQNFKLGMPIPANSNIIFAMHYPNGSYGELDSTKVIFHFYPQGETGIRTVTAAPILQNWSLSIPPNQETSFTTQYPNSGGLPGTVSILSVFPHMHLLGKSIKAYALSPLGDTIKYVDVPKWDFHWQDFYFFKNIQKTPSGSVLKGEATYDNTTNNLNNPSSPPVHVYAGTNTTDEMFLVYFHYMAYQTGDELVDIESLTNLSVNELMNDENGNWSVYPVPFTDEVSVQSKNIKAGDQLSMFVYDVDGRLVKVLAQNTTVSSNFQGLTWDGTNENGSAVKAGMYFLSLNLNGAFESYRVLKSN